MGLVILLLIMQDLTPYKIEVVPGINDAPEEPNYNNNGKGCNGAYVVDHLNGLIDALMYVGPTFTSLTSNITSTTIEVGEKIFDSATPVNLTYQASQPSLVDTAYYLAAGTRISNTSYAPGTTLTYSFPDYNAAPNIYLNSNSYTWGVEGSALNGQAVGGSPSITVNWRYKTFVGYSTSDSVTDYADLTLISSTLTRPTSVTKPASASAYLYIFLPSGVSNDGWGAYSTFKISGFDAVMAPVTQQTITRLGVSVVYRVYRLFYPTAGSFTLVLT